MDDYIEQTMDKVTDLQQQTHFCINNYDYYHKNNELQICEQQAKQLRVSGMYLEEFNNTIESFQSIIKETKRLCKKVDGILENCTLQKGKKDVEETDSNKENTYFND